MSEIGEKAEKIWRENSEIIRRKKELIRRKRELIEQQTKHYANLILDVFGASNETDCVSVVIVSYGSYSTNLKCLVQFFDDIDGKTDNCIHGFADNKKVMEAMDNVNACKTANDCEIITRIYKLLAENPKVTKYFEVTSNEDREIVIKMRPEEDVTLNEAICENEEPKE